MKRFVSRTKATIQGLFSIFGLVVLTARSHQTLQEKAQLSRRYRMLEGFPPGENLPHFFELSRQNFAQLDQDLLAVLVSKFKRNGFFVEFGATNGVDLSNSLLLETQLGWQGILAEPGQAWHDALGKSRKVSISHEAVWRETGKQLEFIEDGALSTLLNFKKSDNHTRRGRTYKVRTISLIDLLEKYDAPHQIDFLSIDTEGSELDVLEGFDFGLYSFGLICVEHNYTENREKIRNLLESKGYVLILSEVSEWDDWFVPLKQKTS